MNLSYVVRLLCVSFASFFLVLVALSMAISAIRRSAIRAAGAAKLRNGLRTLFVLRIAPAAVGLLVVLALCVPSYLWLEPAQTQERVGLACMVAAILGCALCVEAMARSARALFATRKFERESLAAGRRVELAGGENAIVLNSDAPVLTLGGVLRPRIVTSRAVLGALSKDELDAAISHERAHAEAGDNLRRLMFLLTPRVPFLRGAAEIERAWIRWAEWAADDRAAGNDPARSLSLASALVRVARLGLRRPATELCANFASCENDLQQRVARLLKTGKKAQRARARQARRGWIPGAAIIAVCVTLLTVVLLQPETLHSVHELLERFTH